MSHEYPSDAGDDEKNDSWKEQKGDRCGKVTVGDLGNWQGGGLGLKLMQKMGYKVGEVSRWLGFELIFRSFRLGTSDKS